MLPALALALLPAAYQGIQGVRQHRLAKRLKESTFIPPELMMNRNLAEQQAYARRAPGQAFAEEQIRRGTANQIAGAQRSFGGDANKVAAVTAAATAAGNDANSRLQAQGMQFSEQAMGRLGQANNAIAGQKRQNRDEFNRAKSDLIAAGDQNIFNAVSNAATAGVTAIQANEGNDNNGGGNSSSGGGNWLGGQLGQISGMGRTGRMSGNPWTNWVNGQLGYPGMDMGYDQSVWNPAWGRSRRPGGYSRSTASYLKN